MAPEDRPQDDDVHAECAREIADLEAENKRLREQYAQAAASYGGICHTLEASGKEVERLRQTLCPECRSALSDEIGEDDYSDRVAELCQETHDQAARLAELVGEVEHLRRNVAALCGFPAEKEEGDPFVAAARDQARRKAAEAEKGE